MFADFFRGKKVLITGHAGFKGSWLTLWLHQAGAEVSGYSLLPDSHPRLYDIVHLSDLLSHELIADIRDSSRLAAFVQQVQPEIVFHLAAQPLVLESYRDPLHTYETNVIGSLNLLLACRACSSVKAVVNITTDKVYENLEDGRAYREDDRLGGYDMYSSSKACSEILTASFRRSFKDSTSFLLATARAGNVIGGGDFARDRLVPDCARALAAGKELVLRHPEAVRPWQFVLEPLAGYMALAQGLYTGKTELAGSFNFGPDAAQVRSVADMAGLMHRQWSEETSATEQNTVYDRTAHSACHEAGLLQLDSSKAEKMLGIAPVLDAEQAVAFSASWYKAFYAGNTDMTKLCCQQIEAFCKQAQERNLSWSKSC